MRWDDREVMRVLRKAVITESDMLDMEVPVGLTVVNKQREKVPVDTSATKNSIKSDVQESSAEKVIDHIGPSTDYAPYIEFGVKSKPNYPIQPFVRPSVFGNERNIINVAMRAFKDKLREKWPI